MNTSGKSMTWKANACPSSRTPSTLRFADRQADQQLTHFLYEAGRGTMTTTDTMKKFRAYYHLIKKQQWHKEAFGIHPVRAVLIETTNEDRGGQLMDLVNHPLAAGPAKPAGLFWFTISPLFSGESQDGQVPQPARYLDRPETVFQDIWALPDRSLHRLGDEENSPVHSGQAGGPGQPLPWASILLLLSHTK